MNAVVCIIIIIFLILLGVCAGSLIALLIYAASMAIRSRKDIERIMNNKYE